MLALKKYSLTRRVRSFMGYFWRYFLMRLRDTDFRVLRVGGQGKDFFLTACIRVKDEARFLPELLAYHVGIGFEHFYIYDNGSSDGVEDVLYPFLERGLVTIVPWSVVPAFPSCYVHFFENFGLDSRWSAFIDADEFIVEKEAGALRSRLVRLSAPALALNWRYFGGSGHVDVPDGLVIENFTKANSAMDDHVKVIVDSKKVVGMYNSHNFFYKFFSVPRTTCGVRVFGSFSSIDQEANVWINHYVYRSKADYLRKAKRGFVDKQGSVERARAEEKADVEFFNHVARDDFSAAALSDKTNKYLIGLGYAKPFVAEG